MKPARATALVNVAAIERNAARLRARLAPRSELCAVVKANGYGHGALASARAALAGGAGRLAVAAAAEALELREGGIDAPILVMGALAGDELETALSARADVVAWDERFVEELERRARARDQPVGVHVKLDTGMGRLGTRDLQVGRQVAERVVASDGLRLVGAMTHFATSDDDPEFMSLQLTRFRDFAAALAGLAPGLIVHAANSAAVLRDPATHLDLARCGIALYGCDPMHQDPGRQGLEPALELRSYVAALKPAAPGESAGYGRRFIASTETVLATIPIGYGDGLRRAFTNNLEVLIAGRRFPLVGTVSMDNITVEIGRDAPRVRELDPVTLIGGQGAERLLAEELARRIGTINYEIVCGLLPRVPRVVHRDGVPA